MPSRDLILKILGDATGAGKALKEAQHDLKETGEHAERTGKHFGGLGKFAAVAGGAAGVGLLVEGLKGAVEAASKEQVAQASLDTALKATHQSVTKMTPALEEATASSRKLGFSDVDTEQALAKLEIASGNTKTSITDLSVAQDIARTKHIDLTSASQMLAQAMTGSQRAAKQLGIVVPPVTTAQDALKESTNQLRGTQFDLQEQIKELKVHMDALKVSHGDLGPSTQKLKEKEDELAAVSAKVTLGHIDASSAAGKHAIELAKLSDKMATGNAVIDTVSQKLHGQAQAYSETAAGGMEAFKVQMEHLQATVGEKLIPVLTKLLMALNDAVLYIEAHWPQISAVFNRVVHDAEVAWENFGRPTFNAIIAVSEKVIGFIQDHWPEISTTVRRVFGDVKEIVETTTTVVRAVWDRFGEDIVKIIKNNINTVEDVFQGVFTTMKGVLNLIDDLIHGRWSKIWGDLEQIVSGAIHAAVAVIKGTVTEMYIVAKALGGAFVDGIEAGLSALGGALERLIKIPINAVINAWNNLGIPSFHIKIKLPGPLPDIVFDTPELSLPDLPTLETGGYVHRTGIAVVHEGETYSGVGRSLSGGLTINVEGDVIGVENLIDRVHAGLLRKQQTMSLGLKAA